MGWSSIASDDVAFLVAAVALRRSGAQNITADATSVTPSLPNASLTTRVNADATTVTPTLPNAGVGHRLTGAVVTMTPSLPDGTVGHRITADVTVVAPTVPDASLSVTEAVMADATAVTPTMPSAVMMIFVAAEVIEATPNLPNGTAALVGSIGRWVDGTTNARNRSGANLVRDR